MFSVSGFDKKQKSKGDLRLLSHRIKPWKQLCAVGGTREYTCAYAPIHRLAGYVGPCMSWADTRAFANKKANQSRMHATLPFPFHIHKHTCAVPLPARCGENEQSWQSAPSSLSAGANSLFYATSISLSLSLANLHLQVQLMNLLSVCFYLSPLFHSYISALSPFFLSAHRPLISSSSALFAFSGRWRCLGEHPVPPVVDVLTMWLTYLKLLFWGFFFDLCRWVGGLDLCCLEFP